MSIINKIMPKLRQLSYEISIVTIGKIVAALGSLFAVYALTNYLSPSEYGVVNLAMTFSIVATQLFIGPLGAGATRFYAASLEYNDLNSFLNVVFKLLKTLNIVIIFFGFTIIAVVQYIGISTDWIWVILVATIFTVISSYTAIYNGIFLASKSQVVTSFHQSVEPWIKTLIAILFIIIFGASGQVVLTGYALGVLLILYSQRYFFKNLISIKNKLNKISFRWNEKIINYSTPFVIWGVFTSMHLISDRWSLQIFSTIENVGMYSVLYQVGYFPITLMISIIIQVVTPYFYKKAGVETNSEIMNNIKHFGKYLIVFSLVLTVLVGLFTYLLKDVIFEYIISQEYSQVSYLLPYMTIAAGLFATGQAATLILHSEAKTNILIKPVIITSLVGTILNFIGAYFYGINGIVLALILYSVIYLIWILRITFYVSKD